MDAIPPTTPPPPPPPPPTTPSARRDPCWSCGYDLSGLASSTCPECGAGFPTGKDLERLHDRLLGGVSRRCIACGAPRTGAGLTRCPTCGMRYSRGAEDSQAPTEDRGKASGRVQAAPAPLEAPRRGRLGSRAVILIVIAGEAVGVGLVILARQAQGSLPDLTQTMLRLAGLSIAGFMLGWLLIHLTRRDARGLRDQLAAGPRGWSHRDVGRCPKCGYDMRGLPTRTCPECGLDVPEDEREQRVRGS